MPEPIEEVHSASPRLLAGYGKRTPRTGKEHKGEGGSGRRAEGAGKGRRFHTGISFSHFQSYRMNDV